MAMVLPSGRLGQTFAVGILLLTVAVAGFGVIAPLLDTFSERAETLRRQQAMARRMEAMAATLPALRDQAGRDQAGRDQAGRDQAGADQAGRDQAGRDQLVGGDQAGQAVATARQPSGMLPGSSDPLAAAALQQKLDELAAASGVRIGSEEILPAQAAGAFRVIAVRVTANTPYRSLVALLLAMAQAQTPMIADELALRSALPNTRDPELTVNASFTVTSFRPANVEPGVAEPASVKPAGTL
jgi:hypothetical protein